MLVYASEGFSSSIGMEWQLDAEGEDFEAQVWVAGEGEEGPELVEVAGCGINIVS